MKNCSLTLDNTIRWQPDRRVGFFLGGGEPFTTRAALVLNNLVESTVQEALTLATAKKGDNQ